MLACARALLRARCWRWFALPPACRAKIARSVHVCRLGEQTMFGHLRKQLGFSRVRWVVSGGGSLTQQIDDFFEVR